MNNGVAFRKTLYQEAVKREKKLKKESHISYGLKITVLNLEELFKSDMQNGIGLIMDTNCVYKTADTNFSMSDLIDKDSLYSYKFAIRSNDTSFAKDNRYRCKCGKISRESAGIICPHCGTATYNHIAIRGWFDLRHLKVVNPFYWAILDANCKYPGILDCVFKTPKERTMEKNERARKAESATNKATIQQKMIEIQMIDRLPTIMDLQDENVLIDFIKEYAKDEAVDFLLENIDSAMTSKIPVINKNMRNMSVRVNINGVPDYQRDSNSSHYVRISDTLNGLIPTLTENTPPARILNALNNVNNNFIAMYDGLTDDLGVGKKSLIRGRCGGRRKGYSSRIVLEGALRPKVDEVAMPYRFFGQMTIDYHSDLYQKFGITPESTYRIKNNIPNLSDCEIMDKVLAELIKTNMNVVIVLRQPAIYRESLVALRLVELHHKNVITLNEMVIDSCLFGDKDGDVVSVFMPDPLIRAQLLFSMSPNKLIFNPLTASVNGSMELVEAGYVNVCLVLPKERDGSIIKSEKELKKLGYHY